MESGDLTNSATNYSLRQLVLYFLKLGTIGFGGPVALVGYSWAAFTPCADSAMVMGDIILTESDLAPAQQEVIRQGFAITAIHNHFVRNRPNVMFMHIDGKGNIEKLSTGVKAIFDKVKESRGADPKAAKGEPQSAATLPCWKMKCIP